MGKTFTVKHERTGEEKTLEGKDLADALAKAELTSIHWKEVDTPSTNYEE